MAARKFRVPAHIGKPNSQICVSVVSRVRCTYGIRGAVAMSDSFMINAG